MAISKSKKGPADPSFGKVISIGKKHLAIPALMGILNITPDSFSDGGCDRSPEESWLRAYNMQQDGAEIIDVGAESSRPGSQVISEEEELARLQPFLAILKQRPLKAALSIDTYKPAVADCALKHGFDMVNDITALKDPQMAPLIARFGASIVLMHMANVPEHMHKSSGTSSKDLPSIVYDFFEKRIAYAVSAGIAREKIWCDPGLGFAKTDEDNWQILNHLHLFLQLGQPLLIGASRKRFLKALLPASASLMELDKISAQLATYVFSQGAQVLRVHHVTEHKSAKACGQALHLYRSEAI